MTKAERRANFEARKRRIARSAKANMMIAGISTGVTMSENLTTLHAMTLDQAKAIEESIGYRYDWTTDQLFEATAHMTRSDLEQFIKALEITATAARQEAHALESYVASRSNGKGHE